jgi:hypothetical protein
MNKSGYIQLPMSKEKFPKTFYLVLFVPFILRALLSLFPVSRWWGIDYLRFLSPEWIAVWTLAGLAVVPLVKALRRQDQSKQLPIIISMALLAAVLCILLFNPIPTFFFGDGGTLVPQIFRLHETGSYDTSIMLNARSGILAGLLLHLFSIGIPALFSRTQNILYPFIGMSFLAIVLLATSYFMWMKKEKDGGLALLLTVLGCAGSLFFFGYVEFYTLPYVLILAYFLSADYALRSKSGLALPVALYILALASHYMFLALLPSLLYLVAVRLDLLPPKYHSNAYLLLASGLVLILWTGCYLMLGFAGSDSRIVMPAFAKTTGAGTQAYTLLSRKHLFDIANIILLMAPVPLSALVYVRIKDRRSMDNESCRFHLIATIFFFFFILFGNTAFGLPRDFDILVPFGIMLALLAYRALSVSKILPRHATLGAAVASFLFVLPWIGIHLSADTSAVRFEQLLRQDDEMLYGDYSLSGYEALRKYYLHEQNTDKEIRILQRMVELLDYPEHYKLLLEGSLAYVKQRPQAYTEIHLWMLLRLQQRAERLLQAGKGKDYSISLSDINLLTTRIGYHAYINHVLPRMRETMRTICTKTGKNTPFDLLAGMEYYYAGNYKAAHELLTKVYGDGCSIEPVYAVLSVTNIETGLDSTAQEFFRNGMAAYPDGYLIPMSFGFALTQKGRNAQAREALELALANDPPEDIKTNVKALLQRIQK